jgi:hypothetical protein
MRGKRHTPRCVNTELWARDIKPRSGIEVALTKVVDNTGISQDILRLS